MSSTIQKKRSDSGSTEEEDCEYECASITHFSEMKGDVVRRHMIAAKVLIKAIELFEKSDTDYDIVPVLLSDSATADTLEELPSLVGNYFVKCVVEGTNLWMTSLSSDVPHGTAAGEAFGQAAQWNKSMNSGGVFKCDSDTNHQFEKNHSSPDTVVSVAGRFRPDGLDAKVLIIEVEVGNRSIRRMRSDYLKYFESNTVVAVVGIKLIPRGGNNVNSAAAVVWTRALGGAVVVSAAYDFGINALSNNVKNEFARMRAGVLPGVAIDAWARCEPVPMGEANPIQWLGTHFPNEIYPVHPSPVHVFPANTFTQLIHNLPEGAQPVVDFTLDLGLLVWVVATLKR